MKERCCGQNFMPFGVARLWDIFADQPYSASELRQTESTVRLIRILTSPNVHTRINGQVSTFRTAELFARMNGDTESVDYYLERAAQMAQTPHIDQDSKYAY